MDSQIKENASFFSSEGFIGRRNYIVNTLIIGILLSLFLIPIYNKVDFFDTYNSIIKAGFAYCILFILCVLLFAVPTTFNVRKRLFDITGKEIPSFAFYFLFIFFTLLQFISFINSTTSIIVSAFLFIFQLFMYIKKGKISSTLQKSEIIKFNWGAFFGTWIWGLLNKTYIALLMIPLFFTPAGFLFALLLGIKGNEWAYKNKQYSSIENFHKSQKNQSIFWSIFTPAVAIVIYIVFIFMFVYIATASELQSKTDKNSPTLIETLYEAALEDTFKSFEFKDGEYRFYMDPKKWVKMSYSAKIEAFNSAYKYAKYLDYKKENKYGLDVMLRTKIYSTYNGEILLEYKIENFSKDDKPLEIMKNIFKGYKLNPSPILP